ncbi:hypothetical protein GTR02_11645 [Kineococcus sp. R8]|uniref:hypothetical protein n=1 Tax=Kineococcus siccus TaxID=2696567 RepID=UPI0014120FB2|nr:hypothetical protein [Kineococcus siccus]NAZ82474.1 hypothetical protein [Kineococcus siccus]
MHRTPPSSAPDWPVALPDVLAELAVRDEVVVDLGERGSLVVRHRPRPAAACRARGSELPALSRRDEDVLRLAGTGLPATGIAEVLGLSLGEVAARLVAVRAAFGVSSTAAAVAAARTPASRGGAQR